MKILFDKHWSNMASVKNMVKINSGTHHDYQGMQMNSDKENSLPLLTGTA